ncbi:MAG: HD domain-containing protein [Butyrivibrio sp.]|jgi:putative two-component system response regulator|nr:HD domain-containing protein [Butyrivibrio sp.]
MVTYGFVHFIELVAVIIAAVCVVLATFHRPNEGQKLTTIISFMFFLVCLGALGRSLSADEALMVYANKIEYLGACNAFSIFVILYGLYMDIHIPRWLKVVMIGSGYVMTVFTCTFDMNTWYYKSFHVEIINHVPVLVKEYGPVHTVYVIMIAAYLVGIASMYIYRRIVTIKNKRRYSRGLAIVAIAPITAYIIEKLSGSTLDLLPYGLIISDMHLVYLIGHRFYDLNSIALDMVYETSGDAIVIETMFHEFEGANQLARTMFPELEKMVVGEPYEMKTPEFAAKREHLQEISKKGETYVFDEHQYRVTFRDINVKKQQAGRIMTLRDITMEMEHTKLLESYREELEENVEKKTQQLQHFQEQMLFGFASLVENKNTTTGGHIRRTSDYVDAITRELWNEGKYADEVTKAYIRRLRRVAPLHDIGKVSIPEEILDKPGKLTPEEFEIMKTHTTEGARIIDVLMKNTGDSTDYELARQVALYHHEKWNGAGYPEGLLEKKIPLCARIMAVADVFDALVSSRLYKTAYSMDQAFRIMLEERGTHFDPLILDVFMKIRPEIEQIFNQFGDEDR